MSPEIIQLTRLHWSLYMQAITRSFIHHATAGIKVKETLKKLDMQS